MERTAEEFLHQTRGRDGGPRGLWFVADYVGDDGDAAQFMLTDGRLMTLDRIEALPPHLAPRFYRQKRSAKRAAQAWLERAYDELAADRATIEKWDAAEVSNAMLDVVRLINPPPGARALPSTLLIKAIRKRLEAFAAQ